MSLIELLEFDTAHFGFKVARMNKVPPTALEEALVEADKTGVKLLIYRCNTDDMDLVHCLEQHGFELMDTLVRYRLDLAEAVRPTFQGPALIRSFVPDEISAIAEIAAEAFHDMIDHFHRDPRLDRAKCDDLYAQWARNSCLDKSLADSVLVAEMGGRVLGFATNKVGGDKTGEGVLYGVASLARRQGIYRALLLAGIDWCRSKGLETMEVATQVNNYPVQRVWVSAGFRAYASWYTFHRWRPER